MTVEKTAIVALFEMHGIDAHMRLVDDLHTMVEEIYSNGFNDGCDIEDPFDDDEDLEWVDDWDDDYDIEIGSDL